MKRIFPIALFLLPIPSFALMEYTIQVAHNDDFFIINDEKFSAQTYCYSWDGFDEGNRVVFIEGSPYGACVNATIVSIDTGEKCELWCE
jgi:hypothetical protein